jgi:hypothetical protein
MRWSLHNFLETVVVVMHASRLSIEDDDMSCKHRIWKVFLRVHLHMQTLFEEELDHMLTLAEKSDCLGLGKAASESLITDLLN